MTILAFVFQDFWHFAGSVILLTVATAPLHTFAAVLAAKAKP